MNNEEFNIEKVVFISSLPPCDFVFKSILTPLRLDMRRGGGRMELQAT